MFFAPLAFPKSTLMYSKARNVPKNPVLSALRLAILSFCPLKKQSCRKHGGDAPVEADAV
jgi:hypothetical protein